jgi:hypothetical protein
LLAPPRGRPHNRRERGRGTDEEEKEKGARAEEGGRAQEALREEALPQDEKARQEIGREEAPEEQAGGQCLGPSQLVEQPVQLVEFVALQFAEFVQLLKQPLFVVVEFVVQPVSVVELVVVQLLVEVELQFVVEPLAELQQLLLPLRELVVEQPLRGSPWPGSGRSSFGTSSPRAMW